VELELYHLKDKLREKLDKAERSYKVLDAMHTEFKQMEQELEEKKQIKMEVHRKETEFIEKVRVGLKTCHAIRCLIPSSLNSNKRSKHCSKRLRTPRIQSNNWKLIWPIWSSRITRK